MLRPCCAEPLGAARNALNFLQADRNAAQHGWARRTKPIPRQSLDMLNENLAIPAGLEPASRGVETCYSFSERSFGFRLDNFREELCLEPTVSYPFGLFH